MAVPRWLKFLLRRYGVPFEEHHHPPVYSASHLAHAEHISGYRVAKAVHLAVRDKPVVVVLPACSRLDLPWVQALVGSQEVRFATEDQIRRWYRGCDPAAVPPVRLRSDEQILMDRGLAHLGTMLFAAGTPEDAVAVRFRDWYRMVRPGVGRFALPLGGLTIPKGPPPWLVIEDEEEMSPLLVRF